MHLASMKAVFLFYQGKQNQTHTPKKPTNQAKNQNPSASSKLCTLWNSHPLITNSKFANILFVSPLQADSLALSLYFSSCCLWWNLWCFSYYLKVPQRFSLYLIVALWSLSHKNTSSAGAAGPRCDWVWIHFPLVSTQRLFLAVPEAC